MADKALPKQDDENVYDVEKIVKRRKKGDDYEYYIKWLGYPSAQNTWEPPENIIDKCLITDFNQKAESKAFHSNEDDAKAGDEPKNQDNSAQHHAGHHFHAKSKSIAIITQLENGQIVMTSSSLNNPDSLTDPAHGTIRKTAQ